MKKIKNKKWLDKHSKTKHFKELKRKAKKKRNSKTKQSDISKNLYKNRHKGNRKTINPPVHFSIIYNPEETLEFFKKLDYNVNHGMPVFINMKKVEILTIDSIMYFLAIVKKYKEIYIKGYDLKMNQPENSSCRALLLSSGFTQFAQFKSSSMAPSSQLLSITNGKLADVKVNKKICDIVISNFGVSLVNIKNLYNIIMELMLNTKHHAYLNSHNTLNEWYIFVRTLKGKNKIEFIFLDTGSGIPNTIRKTILETTKKWILEKTNMTNFKEWHLISSALEGMDFRSRTGKIYRGKGLPKIQSIYKEGYIQNLKIISNYGYISKDDNKDIKNYFNGTLFYWELTKEIFYEN